MPRNKMQISSTAIQASIQRNVSYIPESNKRLTYIGLIFYLFNCCRIGDEFNDSSAFIYIGVIVYPAFRKIRCDDHSRVANRGIKHVEFCEMEKAIIIRQ